MGAKSRVTRTTGSINDSTTMLTISIYVELRRTKVKRKELKIGSTMEYGQSRLVDWDRAADVKEDLLANPP